MQKSPIKARFIIASTISSIKSLAGTIASIFHLSFRQIQTYNDKSRFFTGVNPIQDGGGKEGGEQKGPPLASFFTVTSTNVKISSQNFLNFSYNPFGTLE